MGKIAKTASEMLAQIEKECFKGVNLKKACGLKGEERRTFRLVQTERMLTTKHGGVVLGMWLSDMFWTADESRNLLCLAYFTKLQNKEFFILTSLTHYMGFQPFNHRGSR